MGAQGGGNSLAISVRLGLGRRLALTLLGTMSPSGLRFFCSIGRTRERGWGRILSNWGRLRTQAFENIHIACTNQEEPMKLAFALPRKFYPVHI